MLLTSLTLVPPTGAPIVLNAAPPFIGGQRVGAMLDVVELGPPVPTVERQARTYARGDHVVVGPEGAREVRITGSLLGRTRAEVNGLRADLVRVCRHHDGDTVGVRYTPAWTQVELGCIVEGVEVSTEPGVLLTFELNLVAGDPVAYQVGATDSVPMGSVGTPAVATNDGDVEAWPSIIVTGPTTGTTTGLVFGNSTTGETLTLTGLTFTTGEVLTVVTSPAFEEIQEDGVNLMAKRSPGARFWALRPGANNVYVTVTGGTGVVATASWTPGWVGY